MFHVDSLFSAIMLFAFLYPLLMSYVWIIGALVYFTRWEWKYTNLSIPKPMMSEFPSVSFIVPCYNEAENIEETIDSLLNQDYINFEVIAVNDGSSDDTASILNRLSELHPQLRVIHHAENQGKAAALRTAATFSAYEYLITIDGDALLDHEAARWIMRHFTYDSRVGAVTGNPRVRTRSTVLGKIQVGEFSAIVGMIKRAQRIYGRMFTVSGVVAGFRKAALQDVGYWSSDTVTEDIDISWRLQLNHWDIRFEPNALCWTLMPETLRGLWKQRVRWSQGGMEALLTHAGVLKQWRKRRMWPIYAEFFSSIFWAYVMLAIMIITLLSQFVELPAWLHMDYEFIAWSGLMLCITCMLQFFTSLAIDSRHEIGNGRYYYWMIWYPMAYWLLSVLTTAVAVPRAIYARRKRNQRKGKWASPDRGFQP